LGTEPKKVSVSLCVALELVPLRGEKTHFKPRPQNRILVLLGVSFLSDEHPHPSYMGFPTPSPEWAKESAILVDCFETMQLADPAKAIATLTSKFFANLSMAFQC